MDLIRQIVVGCKERISQYRPKGESAIPFYHHAGLVLSLLFCIASNLEKGYIRDLSVSLSLLAKNALLNGGRVSLVIS